MARHFFKKCRRHMETFFDGTNVEAVEGLIFKPPSYQSQDVAETFPLPRHAATSRRRRTSSCHEVKTDLSNAISNLVKKMDILRKI